MVAKVQLKSMRHFHAPNYGQVAVKRVHTNTHRQTHTQTHTRTHTGRQTTNSRVKRRLQAAVAAASLRFASTRRQLVILA